MRAPMVKWISQSTSDRLSRVRVLLGAPIKSKKALFFDLCVIIKELEPIIKFFKKKYYSDLSKSFLVKAFVAKILALFKSNVLQLSFFNLFSASTHIGSA